MSGTTNLLLVQPNTTVATAVGGRTTVREVANGNNEIISRGEDVIYTGSGSDTVFAGGSEVAVYAGTGQLLFVGGPGADYVQGGSARATMVGGTGTDVLVGGTGGPNVLLAGSGNDTLIARSAGDLMFGGRGSTTFVGSPAGHGTMVGGSGRNVFNMSDGDVAFGGTGSDTFVTDRSVAVPATIVEGSGTENVVFGIGQAIAYGGQGNDTYTVADTAADGRAGTKIEIVGFKASDHLDLQGLSSAEVQRVVAGAASGAWGTTLSLPNGTQIVLFSVHGLSSAQVTAG